MNRQRKGDPVFNILKQDTSLEVIMIQAIGQNFQFDDGVGMVAEVST